MRSNAKPKISATRNYRLFKGSADNRPLDMKRHKKLEKSMRLYGFLSCFPIVCCRNGDKALIVKDGQHRLAIAETLGLPVYYTEESVDFDVSLVNDTPKVWQLRDHAMKYAANGNGQYQRILDFAEAHKLPLGTAASLLAGTTSWGNCKEAFIDGKFVVKDQTWADAVASVYGPMTAISSSLRNARFVEACMAICRVEEFDAKRLLRNAARCREKLVSFSTKDAYLEMLEEVYNFGHHKLIGLKAAATMAMRERIPIQLKK